MKKVFLCFFVCTLTFLWCSCEKHNYAEGILSPYIAVEDVRSIYKGSEVKLNESNLRGAEKIVGIVISRADSGNVPGGVVILQNFTRGNIRGIALDVGAEAASFRPGDSLMVTVKGAALKRVNGTLTISGLADTAIRKVGQRNTVTQQVVSPYTLNLRPEVFESTLIRVKSVSVSPAPVPGEIFAGDRFLIAGIDSIGMHTEPAAGFANKELPGGASIGGVVFLKAAEDGALKASVWPQTYADITERRPPVDPNAPHLGNKAIIITGFANDVKGSDGNYEYVQFMATEDIDFAVTPASVFTCTNAGGATPYPGAAPAGGWVTGGGRTYKFELTQGVVRKGEFFYVGGSNKRINGANSTSISNAKWVRAIAYVSTDGDGAIGASSSGLLPNSGNAGGIAVFDGVNIVVASVPMDVVFFGGTGIATIVNVENSTGYRIADNDHYHTVDPETHEAQPFFFQGSNLYVIPHQNPSDQGIFVKLGGVLNSATKTWEEPRGYEFFLMEKTSPLTSIETGKVTLLK
ncbi:DUF5689 domain-containing protein [Pararcticibacter amylolyticus]|nr:DUF5689 domain-containing protein [Pararcticibacter amylolyticus]